MIKLKARIYGWSGKTQVSPIRRNRIEHTVGCEKVRVAFQVAASKCLHDSVNLLSFSREADMHQQLPKSDVEGIIEEVEIAYIRSQSTDMKGVSTRK
jgi:hypothetical protein